MKEGTFLDPLLILVRRIQDNWPYPRSSDSGARQSDCHVATGCIHSNQRKGSVPWVCQGAMEFL